MKNKLLYIGIEIILAVGAYFIVLYQHPIASIAQKTPKCFDDYPNNDAGRAEFKVAFDKWNQNFYDSHPRPTLQDWQDSRYQFWVDNNCTTTLQRLQDMMGGKIDPAAVEPGDDNMVCSLYSKLIAGLCFCDKGYETNSDKRECVKSAE